MFELQGKYNTCKIYAEGVDTSAVGQLIALMNQECTKDSIIRIMPDCHGGKTSTIGTTMTIKDKVIPNIVGVDVGCGILCVQLKEKRINLPMLDSIINKLIPSGANVHKDSNENRTTVNMEDLKCYKYFSKEESYMYKSIGTLGGGNHFIEIDKDEDENLYLLIHSGSRNLGVKVCEYYQKQGYAKIKNSGLNIPFELSFVEGELFNSYIQDMKLTQQFAKDNRAEMARIILKNAKIHAVDVFDTIHNYIDMDSMILRKGAISAKQDEIVTIPINMKDGTLICKGKGNSDWNYSAPHGAGRIMSRADAKESIGMKEYKEIMSGIFSTSVTKSTIDESPMAYRSLDYVLEKVQDTVNVLKQLKPIYNFKAH